MSFPRYPKYKDSGVEWLGAVPGHWELKPLWTHFRRVKRTGFDTEQLLSVYRDYGVITKASRDDNFNKPSDDLSVYQLVIPGDLAINKMKAWQGSVAISEYRGIVSPAYFVYEALHNADSRYLHYLMRSVRYITGYLSVSKGIRVNQWDLEPQLHSRMPLIVPPLPEQTKIATFLDRETAKIDELVAEQQRLMELLKEKRQAVISHAVTQGLNPNAPMKPSGIEWLGDVPAHWEVVSLKRFCDVRDGTHDTPQFIDASDVSFPFVTSKDLVNGQVCLDETKHVSATDYHEISRRSGVARGDVLMPMIGSIGGAVLVETDVHFAIKNIALFKASTNYNSRWLQLMLDSDLSVLQFGLNRSGGVQGFVALGTLRNLSFPFPSLDEQDKIVSFLAIESAKFDTLTAEAQRAIDLLQERRTALISAAVTGQIDVRQLTEKQAA